MHQNAVYSGGRGWSEWSLHRRPFQCVLGQASRAFSSMSIVAPNCCQRAVLHKGSIYIPPGAILIRVSRVGLLVSMSILEFHFSFSIIALTEDRGQRIRYGRSDTTRALNQAVDARTRWYAPRQGEPPQRHTQGDSPRRTNVWFPDTYRRWPASPQPGAPAPSVRPT